MKQLNLLSILVIFSLLINCDKDDNNATSFSGITNRDTSMNLIGSDDTTDWRFDKEKNAKFDELFAQTNPIHHSPTSMALNGNIFLGYPNPTPINEPFILSGDIDSALFVDYRVVNSNYQVLVKLDSLKTGFALQYNANLI